MSRSRGRTFDLALREGAGERALTGLAERAARQQALLEIAPGTEAALRLTRRATPADQGIRVPYVDVHIFADELASYGPEVRVVRTGRTARAGDRAFGAHAACAWHRRGGSDHERAA